jgi:hypothetical protein
MEPLRGIRPDRDRRFPDVLRRPVQILMLTQDLSFPRFDIPYDI